MPAFYTNVTPPTLPTWDTGEYPYYLVTFNYNQRENDWDTCRVTYSSAPFEYSNGMITNSETCYYQFYTDGTWLGTWLSVTDVSYKPGLTEEIFIRVWTSHDIPGLMKAGGITPGAWLMNHKDFWTGVAMGLKSKGFPAKQDKQPIAYLYNGVQLPGLPAEILAYPYITIQPSGNNYVVRAFKEQPSAYESGVAIFYGIPSSVETECLTGNLNVDKTGWSYTTWTTGTSSLMYYKEESILNTLKPIFWTNTDIYDLDGSLWLSASEPVPVYGGGN